MSIMGSNHGYQPDSREVHPLNLMNHIRKTLLAVLTLTCFGLRADVSTKLTKVHLCCPGCVNAAQEAATTVKGVTFAGDKNEGTVSLTAPDAATLQKAADALVGAGFYGTPGDAAVKLKDAPGAKGVKVQTLELSGVHLCCGKCVAAVEKAVMSVAGVKGQTAEKNAKTFTVTGDFNDKDVVVALQKAGFAARVGK